MKTISLKAEMSIMHGTRGAGISKPFTVNGEHFPSLKAAINAAKGFEGERYHISVATGSGYATVVTVINQGEFYDVVMW